MTDGVKLTLRDLRDQVGRRIKDFLGERSALSCFERARRLLEEAAELAQAEGIGEEQARKILDRVYSRPKGDPNTEGADVGLTYLAWTYAAGLHMDDLVSARLHETAGMRDKIRAAAVAKAQLGIGLAPEEG